MQMIAQMIVQERQKKATVGTVRIDFRQLKDKITAVLGQLTLEDITEIITALKVPEE